MAKNDETVEKTVTFKRKTIVTAGWIAGGVLALGATFAAGAAVGHVMDGPRGGDFAAGQPAGPGQFGPQGGHGMDDRDGEFDDDQRGHGPRGDGDGDHGPGMGGMMAPSAPTAPNNGSTAPAPTTAP